jgi:23S rRNA (guanosine2251-2'-O)-methyltransferase
LPRKKNLSKKTFSGNHQRSWLWGLHAVGETLQSGKWPILGLYVTRDAFQQAASLLAAKQREGIPIEVADSSRLEQLCGSSEHQGWLARMGPFPYQAFDAFKSDLDKARTDQASPQALPPLVVICDRIQDTFNFGAILRCCDGAAVAGVIVGDERQAEVTPHVARSSSGAVNHLRIAQAEDLLAATRELKELGLQVIAADAHAAHSVWEAALDRPTALVIGSEAHGIRPELLELCDRRVIIPMLGQVTSLNAAVAAGILLFEIRRQQQAGRST